MTALRTLAKSELKAWDEAYESDKTSGQFRPVGSLNGQIGSWESKAIEAEVTKALGAGLVTAVGLPTERPTHGFVDYAWAGGAMAWDVTLNTAQRTFEEIRAEGLASGVTCSGCRPVRFTGAKIVNVDIPVNLGSATTQAWALTLDNSAVLITRVAVAVRIYPLPPEVDAFHPLGNIAFQSASGTASGKDLTVTFVVSKKDDSHPCTMNYATEAVESQGAIVVILVAHPDPAVDNSQACVALGVERTATVHLASPLGIRAVIESVSGQPVDVTLLP